MEERIRMDGEVRLTMEELRRPRRPMEELHLTMKGGHSGTEKWRPRMEEGIRRTNEIMSKASVVNKDCMHGVDRSEEKKDIDALLNEAVKKLSAEELTKIIREDLQFCVDNKTVNPLLWVCGLDVKEPPMSLAVWVDYSPDVRIGFETHPEYGEDVSPLFFSIKTDRFVDRTGFDLSNVGHAFNDVLDGAEDIKREIEGEELTDEDLDDPGDR